MNLRKILMYQTYCPGQDVPRFRLSAFLLVWLICGMLFFSIPPSTAKAQEGSKEASKAPSKQGDMGEIGKKLANPLGDLWALNFNSFVPGFFDGNVNQDEAKLGATTIFQPILPVPLYGEGKSEFSVIMRPVVPLVWSTPIPEGFDDFNQQSGIGDIQLPFLFKMPASIAGKWILGAGPVFEFPTATDDDLGADQWSAGPGLVLGHKWEHLTAVLFYQHFWKIGESGQDDDTPDTNKGSLLYSFQYALKDGWQVGTNPNITYNDKASSGNKWNVPVGLFVGKTMKFGKLPVNIKLGVEYSVVRPDDFGQQAAVRLQITPIMPGLIQNPIFGK